MQNLQCTSPNVTMGIDNATPTYNFNIGIVVFGTASNVPIDDVIAYYKNFIESNSKFSLTILKSQQPQLPANEIGYYSQGYSGTTQPCYSVEPWTLSSASKAAFPPDAQCNIVLWYWENVGTLCCQGCTLGGDWGINSVPITTIPFGYVNEPINDPNWKYHTSQVMVHEFLNELNTIMGQTLGVPNFPSAENCLNLPSGCPASTPCFTNQYGWRDCYNYILSQITESNYIDLRNYRGYGKRL